MKDALRLQRKLYTLLLVMMIAFGGLAVVMFKMILAFQVDMDGMRDNMDRMTPAIVMMSSTMSGLADHHRCSGFFTPKHSKRLVFSRQKIFDFDNSDQITHLQIVLYF